MSYNTTQELLTLLQSEVGDTNPTGQTTQRYLNLLDTAHKAIVGGGGELNLDDSGNAIRRPYLFSWAKAEDPISLTLEPKQSGTADVTQDNASVTISINSGTKDLTGWHIRFGQQTTVYRILTHNLQVITLNSTYTEVTASAQDFDCFKLIYTIQPISGSILLPEDLFRVYYRKTGLSMTDEAELLDQYPLYGVKEGYPQLSGIVKQTSSGIIVRFSHYPKDRQKIDLSFVPKPSDLSVTGSNPIIPNEEKRRILVHLAAFYHMRKRDDDRASSHLKTAQQLFDALTTEDMQFTDANDASYGYIAPFPGGFSASSFVDNTDVDNLP